MTYFKKGYFFLGGRWFSKKLLNILGGMPKYLLFLTVEGGWVVWKRPKTPLHNKKMAPVEKFCFRRKLYIPSTVNPDPIFWHRLWLQ